MIRGGCHHSECRSCPSNIEYSTTPFTNNNSKSKHNKSQLDSSVWYKSDQNEKDRIRAFWLQLSEEERKDLVVLEKEAVIKKIKEQQKQACSCPSCGKKRSVIEEELEMMYDAYYDELEHYSNDHNTCSNDNHSHPHQKQRFPDDAEEFYGIDDLSSLNEFGGSLTAKGGILTVADDFLKNDGRKFLDLMEQLSQRKLKLLEEDERDYEDYEDDDDYIDDDDDEENSLSGEERMEEGRRMFQIFAAKMFEQRVLSAYREKVSNDCKEQLLRELELEEQKKQQSEEAKRKKLEKKKAQKKAQKIAKEEERKRLQKEKEAEEEAERQLQQKKQEAERLKREEEQRKWEEERNKKLEAERLKREAERKKQKEIEERKKLEKEKKQREKEERERKVQAEKEKRRLEEKERLQREAEENDPAAIAPTPTRTSPVKRTDPFVKKDLAVQIEHQSLPPELQYLTTAPVMPHHHPVTSAQNGFPVSPSYGQHAVPPQLQATYLQQSNPPSPYNAPPMTGMMNYTADGALLMTETNQMRHVPTQIPPAYTSNYLHHQYQPTAAAQVHPHISPTNSTPVVYAAPQPQAAFAGPIGAIVSEPQISPQQPASQQSFIQNAGFNSPKFGNASWGPPEKPVGVIGQRVKVPTPKDTRPGLNTSNMTPGNNGKLEKDVVACGSLLLGDNEIVSPSFERYGVGRSIWTYNNPTSSPSSSSPAVVPNNGSSTHGAIGGDQSFINKAY